MIDAAVGALLEGTKGPHAAPDATHGIQDGTLWIAWVPAAGRVQACAGEPIEILGVGAGPKAHAHAGILRCQLLLQQLVEGGVDGSAPHLVAQALEPPIPLRRIIGKRWVIQPLCDALIEAV